MLIEGHLCLPCSFDAPEGLRLGSDSVTQDFATNIYRMKQLGFNAVRLPYRQADFNEPWAPRIIEHQCQVAPAVSYTCLTYRILHHCRLIRTRSPGGTIGDYMTP